MSIRFHITALSLSALLLDPSQAQEPTIHETASPLTRAETGTAAASWPCWMGPNHTGISNETHWQTQWPREGLPVAWTRQIGIGFSSMSIVDGRLYTMGHVDGNEMISCLDAKTGEPVWHHTYPGALIDNLYEGGPGSTPTVHLGFVYSLGKEGQLFCLRAASGAIVWQKDLREDLGVETPEWGFNSSAYILGDAIILEAGRIVSYHHRTGEKNWQSAKHHAGYGTAAKLQFDGKTYIATLDCQSIRVTDASNGNEAASYPWSSPYRTNSTTPIILNDSLYVSTGYQVGCGLFRFTGDELVPLYENREMRNHFNNSILLNGALYGFDGNSNLGRVVHLVCMDHKTGAVAWKQRGFGCGSVTIVNGKLLILTEDGMLVLAEATTDEYRELAKSPMLEGRCWTVPVLCDRMIYGRNAAGKLVALDASP